MAISMLAAAYLFFGGAGAGLLFFACLLEEWSVRRDSPSLLHRGDGMPFRQRCFGLALGLFSVGLICLVFDLGRPQNALIIFLHPTWTFLSVGAYLLATCVVLTSVLLIRGWFFPKMTYGPLCSVMRILALPCALAVMVYTGLLLNDLQPVPLWRLRWIPALFLASSLAAGAACMVLCSSLPDEGHRRRAPLERRYALVDLGLALAEALFAAAFVSSLLHGALSAQSLDSLFEWGAGQALFCGGFLVCGIAIPLAGDVLVLIRRSGAYATWLVALFCLIGCFCLRLAMATAGIHIGV